MNKILLFVFVAVLLTACGDMSDKEISQALTKEGIKVQYGDEWTQEYYDFVLNDRARLGVYIEKDKKALNKRKTRLEHNVEEKQSNRKLYTVNERYLFVYTPPKQPDEELDKKVSTVITTLNE
ncbi:hypothetical protein KZ483_25605 [Paenibacillus sp. sptzw28]|uniref:hypothetical protein n=1 Tax=Paenibacillus sp. sptzw28 TaxID=715179 RepID=UPI001C6EE7F2|nr:hypothetical protein [Paenibacillus sp. sptzw28]QYR21059.1 hypothetical protein KZ483_25605 [Paenibacillus sp. sptzw28]